MLIKRLTRQALILGLSGLVVTSVLLSACGNATEPSAEATAPLAATETKPPETEPTQTTVVELNQESEAEELLSVPVDPVACLPVNIPENTLVQAASAADWATGPEDAAVTVIEYGDFQ